MHEYHYFTLLKVIAFEPLAILSNLHGSLLGRFKMNMVLRYTCCSAAGMFGGGRWEGRGRNAENIRKYCREKLLQNL